MAVIDVQVHAYERNHPGRPWAGHLYGRAVPPERLGEAADRLLFTETWEFRAMVAEAVTAALVKALPRIIAALTGNTL